MNQWHATPDPRYSTPHTLPHVAGWAVVHQHDDGERCNTDGAYRCRYVPSLWSRIKTRLGLTW